MKAVIAADSFKRLINNSKKFTRVCSNRLMSYIYLDVDAEKNIIRAEAVDGHRLSVEYSPVIEADSSFKCYVKANIPKITARDRAVELELIGNKCYVTVGENITGYVQPEGKWFDLDKVINDAEEKPVTASIYVDPKLLKEALDSIGEGAYRKGVKLEIRGKRDPIMIRPEAFHLKDNIKIVLPIRHGGAD